MKFSRKLPCLVFVCLLSASALAAGPVPATLQGEWQMSEGTGSSYRNPNTGAQGAPNVNVYAYRILPDGTYQHAALLTSTLYDCTMQVYGFETGVLEVDGDRIVFEDREAKLTSKDNCRPEFNYEKPGKLSKSVFRWRLERDEGGDVLVLRWPNEKEDRYHRVKKNPE